MTKEADVQRAVEEAVKEFGRIDYAASVQFTLRVSSLLISYSNFAGVIGPLGPTWDTNLDDWKRVLEVNTVGVWLCNKYQLKQMMKQDSIEVYFPQAIS